MTKEEMLIILQALEAIRLAIVESRPEYPHHESHRLMHHTKTGAIAKARQWLEPAP